MKTFGISYKDLMNEPAHVVNTNLNILSLEAEEQERKDKLEKLKSKHG